jgi:uncharacterized protein YcnI
MYNNRLASRMCVVLGACATATLLFAGVSYAHVEPDPVAVEAGKSATVAFSPAHGCDGSPTISLAFKVPASVTDAAPVTKSGWKSDSTSGVITFSGGSLGATASDHFDITFTAPAKAGPIYFPVVQTCVKGKNNWIDLPNTDGSEPQFAAPVVLVTAGPPTSADLVVPTEAPDGSVTPNSPDVVTPNSPDVGTVPVGGESPDNEPDKDNQRNITVIFLIVIGAAAVVAGIVVYVKRGGKED